MLGLYLGALAFGGILIAVSVLLGGGDGDFDKDVDFGADADMDLDADADVDFDADGGLDIGKDIDLGDVGDAGDAALWLPFLSLRFWTFGSAGFGLVGAMLTYTSTATIALIAAILTGLFVGTSAAWIFRQLKRNTVTSDVGLARFVGTEARVLLPVAPGDMGTILIDSAAGHVELTARTGDAALIPRGAKVLITEVIDGTANVTGLPSLPGSQENRTPRRTHE